MVCNLTNKFDRAKVEEAVRSLLEAFGEDVNREGLVETPRRVAGYWEELLEGNKYTNEELAENLKKDLTEKITQLEEAANFFALWQPKMEVAFKDSVTTRFRELLGEGYDQQRVLTEIAALLVKYTINEEIVRLKSHLKALKAEIAENPTPGRKIDFICQEINREINTIGSKNQFTEVGTMVVTAKNALENIREQARNVE